MRWTHVLNGHSDSLSPSHSWPKSVSVDQSKHWPKQRCPQIFIWKPRTESIESSIWMSCEMMSELEYIWRPISLKLSPMLDQAISRIWNTDGQSTTDWPKIMPTRVTWYSWKRPLRTRLTSIFYWRGYHKNWLNATKPRIRSKTKALDWVWVNKVKQTSRRSAANHWDCGLHSLQLRRRVSPSLAVVLTSDVTDLIEPFDWHFNYFSLLSLLRLIHFLAKAALFSLTFNV